MKSDFLTLKQVTSTEFKSYLRSRSDNSNWFYWHIQNDLNGFINYKIYSKSEAIGVLCLQEDHNCHADIYIDKKYRRMGYGWATLKYISSNFRRVVFKVSIYNKESIQFFDQQYAGGTIKSKLIFNNYFEYAT